MSKTILIVDDSSSIRRMMEFSLVQAGYQVESAVDGREGLAKATATKFDAILTDLNMPGMDGLALLEALRKLPSHKTTPILVLTTEARQEVKDKGRALGATGWMVKPFDPQKLAAVVAKLTGGA